MGYIEFDYRFSKRKSKDEKVVEAAKDKAEADARFLLGMRPAESAK